MNGHRKAIHKGNIVEDTLQWVDGTHPTISPLFTMFHIVTNSYYSLVQDLPPTEDMENHHFSWVSRGKSTHSPRKNLGIYQQN